MVKILIYALKCWSTCIAFGLLGFLLYCILKSFKNIEGPFMATMVFSIPSFIIIFLFCLFGYHTFKSPQKFRTVLSVLCFSIWLLFTVFAFGLRFYNFFRLENLIFMPQMIGLVFGIWYYQVELKKSIEVENEDILDVEI